MIDSSLTGQEVGRFELETKIQQAVQIALANASGMRKPTLSDTAGLNPPILPSPLVSRLRDFGQLSYRLDSHSCVAVVGYPKSGKTTAIAEYASALPTICLWLDASESTTRMQEWRAVIQYQIACHLDLDESSGARIETQLAERAVTSRILIVVDDAHVLNDFRDVDFLIRSAAASHGRMQVILVGVDEPPFIERLRSNAIPDWRLPGLSEQQGIELLRHQCPHLSDLQLSAIRLLVLKTDGHPGMIRLSSKRILNVDTETAFTAFLRDFLEGIGTGLEAFQASLAKRFRQSLEVAEYDLCRRVSISLRAFPKRVAKTLWMIDRDHLSFENSWEGCLLRAFDHHSRGRYSLPYLYRTSMLESLGETEKEAWYNAAASELAEPQDGSLDPQDVSDSFFYRVFAKRPIEALDQATLFFAAASGRHSESVRKFLYCAFTPFLPKILDDPAIPRLSLIRWYCVSLPFLRDSKRETESKESTYRLLSLLRSSDSKDTSTTVGWGALLFHGAATGDLSLCYAAGEELAGKDVFDEERSYDWVSYTILSTCLTLDADPLPYLQRLISDRPANSRSLWDPQRGFDLWRSVGHAIYNATKSAPSFSDRVNMLVTIAGDARRVNEQEVAVILEATICKLQIDFLRDLSLADETANRLCLPEANGDRRLKAMLLHLRGTTSRCLGNLDQAVEAYRSAIDTWPVSHATDREDSRMMFGICLGRQKDFVGSTRHLLASAKYYEGLTQQHASTLLVQALLESAASATNGGLHAKALRSLIRAHRVLEAGKKDSPEWAALGTLAWYLADQLDRTNTGPEAPVSGFTIAFRGDVHGFESMEPLAPTMMLGRACVAHQLPYRGLKLLDYVKENRNDPSRTIGASRFGFEAALALGRLDLLVEQTASVVEWMIKNSTAENKDKLLEALLEVDVGRIVHLATELVSEADFAVRMKKAISIVEESSQENIASRMLAVSLSGILQAMELGDLTVLESSISLSLDRRIWGPARNMYFFLVAVYARHHRFQEADFFVWQWRLIWLTCQVPESDLSFYRVAIVQQRQLLSHLRSDPPSEWVAESIKTIDESGSDAVHTIQELRRCFASHAYSVCGGVGLIRESECQIKCVSNVGHVEELRIPVLTAISGIALLPNAASNSIQIRSDVNRISAAVALRIAEFESSGSLWPRTSAALRSIATFVETENAGSDLSESLLQILPYVADMGILSQCHYYIVLRFSLSGLPLSPKSTVRSQVFDTLAARQVSELVESPKVPDFLWPGLAVAYFSSRGFMVIDRLLELQMTQAMQIRAGISPPRSAVAAVFTQIRDAIEDLQSSIAGLDDAEFRCLKPGYSTNHLWQIRQDRGSLRKIGASVISRCVRFEDVAIGMLRLSLSDFRTAIAAAKAIESDERAQSIQRLAQMAIEAAHEIGDLDAEEEFLSELKQIGLSVKNDDGDQVQVGNPDGEASQEPLVQHGAELLDSSYVSMFMKASGIPEHRRKYVEDDAAKLFQCERMRVEYCRHLQPLQNLLHTRSVETIYAGPTLYTCECNLLGYSTSIEMEDIDVVLDAMKRTYCEQCPKRSPLLDVIPDAESPSEG